MYHRVSPDRCDDLTVTVAQLEAQLDWLRDAGFRFVALADLLAPASSLPDRPVLVTFDDAYLDTYELAVPVLQRR